MLPPKFPPKDPHHPSRHHQRSCLHGSIEKSQCNCPVCLSCQGTRRCVDLSVDRMEPVPIGGTSPDPLGISTRTSSRASRAPR